MAGVKLFLSGVENSTHFNYCLQAGAFNLLTSYYQFYDKDKDTVKKRKQKHPQLNFLIDSGAHTFITDWMQFTSWKQKDFDEYAENYVRWIYDNRDYLWCAVELDIDLCLNMVLANNQQSTLGTSIVESWQKSLFMPLQKKGIRIIYVWHKERGLEGWEDMCAKFDYVGLPGNLSKENEFNKYMAIARRYCTRVHGFAATTQVDFRDAPWYTVDSITWKTGEIYGTLIDWDEHLQKLIFCTNKAERHLFREKLKRHGFDAEAIVGDTNYKELTRYGLFSYRRMEKFYAERYRNRVMFYELRLPHRNVLHQLSPKALLRKWERFRPEEKFKEHAHASTQQILEYLCVLSSVQNGDSVWLQNTASAKAFLEPYFPKLVDPFPSDPRILQKELAVYTAPPNPPPKAREDSEHYRPMNNPPRAREEVLYCPEDLQLLSFYPEPEKLYS